MPSHRPPSWAPGSEHRDAGVGLVEVLVAMGLFSLLGSLLLGLALSTSQVSERTRNMADVSAQSRLAMERMTRELREASAVLAVDTSTTADDHAAITFWTDFNQNTKQDADATDPEVMTYRWDRSTDRLLLTATDSTTGKPVTRPLLSADVTRFAVGLRSSGGPYDVKAGLRSVDLVTLEMTVSEGTHDQTYRTRVDLRNRS
jgi:type II secretory pathway pseudopilin PulG